jgi:4-amino-4-deoxy-L-arabinose transferase-like glycosyltransferase
MAASENLVEARRHPNYLVLLMLGAGAAVRLYLAWRTFLNPDEALHYFVAAQPSFAAAYKASLTMAHPPLMILLLHAWSALGTSELFARLPFVAAGLLFAWVMFLWTTRIAGETAGTFALALCLFLPSLISLSAEIRQYSLLLLFCAVCLYYLELGIEQNSIPWIAASFGALYLALLTHYSALIFAAAVGIYGLLLVARPSAALRLRAAWALAQIVALAICGLLFESQIAALRRSGVPSEIAGTWLRDSIFQYGQDHLFPFIASKTIRLFRYFFAHGTIGILGLLLFLYGVSTFLRRSSPRPNRALALLLLLPFLIMLTTAVTGNYPYGGTRHDVLLVIFAVAGIAIGLDRLNLRAIRSRPRGAKCVVLAAGLLVCNAFPSPTGPTIRPRNQSRGLMSEAVAFVHSLPSDSALLTDYQSGLVLGYYFCGKHADLPFGQNSDQVFRWQCGKHTFLTSLRSQQALNLPNLLPTVQQSWNASPQEQALWLFQTGWIEDKKQEWLSTLQDSGCADTHYFGPNIRICQITR